MAAVVITAFEVPSEADDAFVAGRDARTAMLHRALRADVALRFVEIARVDDPARWRDGAAEPPFPAHAGIYETEQEDGDPDGAGGVLLFVPFDVPAAGDERFVAGWSELRKRLEPRQGYLGTRLHRRVDGAGFPWVAAVRWSSPLMYARALRQPEIEQSFASLPFPGRPALYLRHAGT